MIDKENSSMLFVVFITTIPVIIKIIQVVNVVLKTAFTFPNADKVAARKLFITKKGTVRDR